MCLGVLADLLAALDHVVERDVQDAVVQVDVADLHGAQLAAAYAGDRDEPHVQRDARSARIERACWITFTTTAGGVAGVFFCHHGGRLGGLGRVEVDPLPALGGFERARQDAVDGVDGAPGHRLAGVRAAAGQLAVVAWPRPGRPVPGGGVADLGRVPCDLRSPAMADDQQPFVREHEERVPDGAWFQPLEPGELGH